MRISFIKKVTRDHGWSYKKGEWQKDDKSYDIEYISNYNGDQTHKFAKRANNFDLIRFIIKFLQCQH